MRNKIKRQKSKRGELTTQQIIMLIIIITSFVIILFLLFRLNLGETSNKEICHTSVVLKSTGKGLVGQLDCTTNYLCISGGGNCEGINPTITTKVNPNSKEEIMKVIADEMTDCWWMFGEGELNYLGLSDKIALGKTSCAICSIIKFDETILEKDYQISYREFYEYLNNLNKDKSQKYFTYLYDSHDVNKFQNEVSYLDVNLDEDLILGEDKYAIVTGVKSGAIWGFLKKDIFIYAYYLKSAEIDFELECDEFVTKA
ncbi:hypothetical protein KAR52_02750 [Candidatus Pacearchaeota archaeon]|nr:hypothetical protein [Candidatus Pacearchaeota archaeon]